MFCLGYTKYNIGLSELVWEGDPYSEQTKLTGSTAGRFYFWYGIESLLYLNQSGNYAEKTNEVGSDLGVKYFADMLEDLESQTWL